MARQDLTDRVIAITGASSGIGAAAARALVEAGARVVLAARRTDRIEQLAGELGEAAIAVTTDVTVPADSEKLVLASLDTFGRLDGLIANAGVGRYGGILDSTDQQLAEMLDINVAGTVWPVRAAVRRLREQGDGGDIVIVSSVAGTSARGNEAVYAATKHAQMGLAQGLDRELHTEGIRVTAMCPGGVVTEFAMQEGAGRTSSSPQLADMLQPEDVAAAIVDVLQQPRSVRTLVYRLRGMTEEE